MARGGTRVTAAIHYESDAYQINPSQPMGRHFAGNGFLSAFARFSSSEQIIGAVRNRQLGQEFCETVLRFNPKAQPKYVLNAQASPLATIGCLYTPALIFSHQAWLRELYGPRSWSLCGVNHTLSTLTSMDAVTDLLTAPIHPWDAIVCTSNASRNVIQRLMERQAEYLSRRLGATRFETPQLPVIPLGVDCEAQRLHAGARDKARAALGLEAGDIVVLFLGRLSYHGKAHPAPMYMALERLASRHRLTLIECGWIANEGIANALVEARAKLCPSVRSIVLDGRKADQRELAWGAADIFCSLSDNVQETFGLTPIEAMATGLPVVVTDWDGYKDTVRNGVDGFAVPTMAAPAGVGASLAMRHALGLDTYDVYVSQAVTGVAVDVDAVVKAFDALASDPDLRRRMGEAGAARAREAFDWKVIVRAYENLWDDLARLRREGGPSSPLTSDYALKFWPARPDPFELFASFPSDRLSAQHQVRRAPGISTENVQALLALKVSLLDASTEISKDFLVTLWGELGDDWQDVGAILAKMRASVANPLTVRGLMWLAKFDTVHIRKPESA